MPGKSSFCRVFALCLAVAFLAGCSSPANPKASNQHLKAGLQALDRGDEGVAETELRESLKDDPANSKARTALASIYAKRAGISWNMLFDLFMEAGKEVDSKMKTYRNSMDMQQFISGVNEDIKANSGDPARAELEKRVIQIYSNVGMAAVGAMIAIDLFHGIPYMSHDQIASLDQAIQVLRDDNGNPELRHEDVKVYLSVLAFVRFIYYTRGFLGSFDYETEKLFTSKSRFCSADAADVKESVTNIQDSLKMVSEGVSITEAEANTPPRRSRLKLYRFVQKFLGGPVWDRIDNFFLPNSEENQVAMRYFTRICGIATQPGGAPAAVPGTGANLFDPDAP